MKLSNFTLVKTRYHGAVENCKTELQNPKLRKTEAKKGQNRKTVNRNVPLHKPERRAFHDNIEKEKKVGLTCG